MTQQKLTIRGPADLIALATVQLGFVAEESIVLMATNAQGRVVHARIDLNDDAFAVRASLDLFVEVAEREGLRRIAGLFFTSSARRARDAHEWVAQMCEAGQLNLFLAVRVHDGRWFDLSSAPEPSGSGAMKASGGVRFSLWKHPFVVDAVFRGEVIRSSREELARRLDDVDVQLATAFSASLSACLGAPVGAEDRDSGRQIEWMDRIWRDYSAKQSHPEIAQAAQYVAWLQVPLLRDVALTHEPPDHPRVTTDWWVYLNHLAALCPHEVRLGLLGILAFCCWRNGDGAMAWVAVTKADELDGSDSLLDLVADLLDKAVNPADLPELRRESVVGSARPDSSGPDLSGPDLGRPGLEGPQ